MIFLILKMFVYLLLALIAGAGAGWVLRHIAAVKQEEDMQRTLADARARVPQFESLIRSRDEQIKRLKEELKDKDARINGLVDDVREAEHAMRDKDRELKTFTARHETVSDLTDEAAQVGANTGGAPAAEVLKGGEAADEAGATAESAQASSSDADLKNEVARLEGELLEARSQAADAMAEAAAAEAEVITLKAELARAGDGADSESGEAIAELEARLKQKSEEHDRLARALESEQRRVTELERERELQNKSLRVLHQQLELEKERGQRAAAG